MHKNLDDLFIFPQEWMDEEFRSVRSVVRQWAEKEILSKRLDYHKNYDALFMENRKKLCLTIGLQRLTLPENTGGFGWNKTSHAPLILNLISEISRADASIGVLLALQYAGFATFTMESNLNKNLCNTLSPKYIAEELRTPTIILSGPGKKGKETPLFWGRSILAEALTSKNGYKLIGKDLRPFVSGLNADLFCIVCSDKKGNPCLALVPGDAKGIRKGSPIKMTGLNACTNADIILEGVIIPKENLIDRDGVVEELYTWLNLFLGGVSLGAAFNFFEILSNWCENRVIKGGSLLKENPLCASVLADVAEEIALARLMLYDLANLAAKPEEWEIAHKTRLFTFAQMIGQRVQQNLMKALNRGLELMGSAGYAKEWHVEKHWRDVKTIQSLLSGLGAEAPVKMDTARFFFDCKEI